MHDRRLDVAEEFVASGTPSVARWILFAHLARHDARRLDEVAQIRHRPRRISKQSHATTFRMQDTRLDVAEELAARGTPSLARWILFAHLARHDARRLAPGGEAAPSCRLAVGGPI
jgi:hypothetical protein